MPEEVEDDEEEVGNSPFSYSSVDHHIEWLIDNAEDAAAARANRSYWEKYISSVHAMCMYDSDEKSAAMKDADAKCDPRYLDALEQLRDAVYKDEVNRAKRAAVEIKIEAWRTHQANLRSI